MVAERHHVSFGRFEADLHSGELWKGTLRLRLPAQPFKLLTMLLEKPGEVVPREEILERLWGKETNVDFDRAIAGAVNKIRDVLCDSAENPTYIETLPKRGYRFVAPVTILSKPSPTTNTNFEQPQSASSPLIQATSPPVLPASVADESASDSWPGASTSERYAFKIREFGLLVIVVGQCLLLAWLLVWREPAAIPEVEQLTYGQTVSSGPVNAENLPGLATDGTSIFFTMQIEGQLQLASIAIETGKIRQIPLPHELASVSIEDISKDGSRLLLLSRLNSSSEQPLWVVPTSGIGAFRVGNILAHAATWMPDDNGILYAKGNDLYVVQLADGNITHFATLHGQAFWMRWSPDGKILRFTLINPMTHKDTLWEIQRGSHNASPISDLAGHHSFMCCGVWSASGKNYIFQMLRYHGSDLWDLRRSLFGSKLVRLTQGPLYYFSPIAGPAGRRIYFLGSDESAGLQRFDPEQHAFVPAKRFLRDATRVEYSPDGDSVIWTDSNGGLWRASASNGANLLQLVPPQLSVFAAHWSPDGSKLALMAKEPGQPYSLYVENSVGGQIRPLLHENYNLADPTWSPNGRMLAFGREPALMGDEPGPHQIYILDLKNGKVQVLPHSDGLFSPRWSPNGKWIAALSLDQKRVMLFNVKSRSWSLLANTSAADPVWGRNSKALYVHAFLADEQPILRLSVPTGEKQVVADLSDIRLREAGNYFFSGLTPYNEPLILPRVGTSNIYTLNLNK